MVITAPSLRTVALATLAVALVSAPALAQSQSGPYLKGRFMVGVTWGPVVTIDDDLGNLSKVSPFFRMNARREGWGPSFGLSWLTAELRAPVDGQRTPIGTVKLRPVMAGVAYARFIRSCPCIGRPGGRLHVQSGARRQASACRRHGDR